MMRAQQFESGTTLYDSERDDEDGPVVARSH